MKSIHQNPINHRAVAARPLLGGARTAFVALLLVVPALSMAGTVSPPTLTASFDRSTIAPGGFAHLTFQVANPNSVPLMDVEFFDDLSLLGMSVLSSSPGGCSGSGPPSLTNRGPTGPSIITIYEATLPANAHCEYPFLVVNSLDVELGAQTTTTSAITSSNGGAGSSASAAITVVANEAPQLSVSFINPWIPLFGTTYLQVRPINPNNGTLTGVAFTIPVPSGLSIVPGGGVSCSQGPLGSHSFQFSAEPGSGVISVFDGTLYPSAQCDLMLKVEGFRYGLQVATTSAITSTNAGSGDAVVAAVAVGEHIFSNGFEWN